MPFQLGDSFWVQTTHEPVEHLWILTTRPNALNDSSIWVNVTTARPWSDRTTVLQNGDHPALRHESVINYRGAKLVDLVKLEGLIQAAQARLANRCSSALLSRIQSGILASKFTPRKIQNHFKAEKAAGRV
jgi:hypothetical protein